MHEAAIAELPIAVGLVRRFPDSGSDMLNHRRLVLGLVFGLACGDNRQIEERLGRINGVEEAEVWTVGDGVGLEVARLKLEGGGSLAVYDIRLEDFEHPPAIRIDEAGGWLPRCAHGAGWIVSVNVIQPSDASFLPGKIRNIQDLISKYRLVVDALAGWPHQEQEATEMRIDGKRVRCFAAR